MGRCSLHGDLVHVNAFLCFMSSICGCEHLRETWKDEDVDKDKDTDKGHSQWDADEIVAEAVDAIDGGDVGVLQGQAPYIE